VTPSGAEATSDDEEGAADSASGFSSEGGRPTAAARHATLTDEEVAVSRVRPTTLNPWVVQPYNAELYRAGSRGASGRCVSCTRESRWSAKGTNRWFAFCSYHMSQWTGWANRAGAQEIAVDPDEIAPPSEWSWDRYLAEGYAEDHVEAARYVVERLDGEEEWEGRRFKLWIKLATRAREEDAGQAALAVLAAHAALEATVNRLEQPRAGCLSWWKLAGRVKPV
jgi:hypothetical protein